MILLISSKYDKTTNIVTQWLNNYQVDYHRLNTESFSGLDFFRIKNKKIELSIKGILFSDIQKVWHRRGRLRHVPIALSKMINLSTYLQKEEDSLIKSLENFLHSKVEYIGSFLQEIENYKLDHLILAEECGMDIPDSLITTSKKELSAFKNEYNRVISKDLRYPINITTRTQTLTSQGTFVIEQSMLDKLGENFAPIYVQELIEKQFEVRTFFYKEQLFSMAIFSQNDPKTRIDFRNYNYDKPNRCVPFNLPEKEKKKVQQFIRNSKLNTGSIDLIYSTNNKFVFLEVNPMGQFDWLSKNCNYHIEKKIAKDLATL